MSTSINKHDTLEQLIYSEGIKIQTIDIHKEMDILLIILNTGGVLKETLSKYPRLKIASQNALNNYELIGKGTGIHWPELDEDLSLKGFLRDAIKDRIITKVA